MTVNAVKMAQRVLAVNNVRALPLMPVQTKRICTNVPMIANAVSMVRRVLVVSNVHVLLSMHAKTKLAVKQVNANVA